MADRVTARIASVIEAREVARIQSSLRLTADFTPITLTSRQIPFWGLKTLTSGPRAIRRRAGRIEDDGLVALMTLVPIVANSAHKRWRRHPRPKGFR
jgi:hypothetical protein